MPDPESSAEPYAYEPATSLGDPLADRLLGAITALAGELFTTKVQLEQLRRTLTQSGDGVTPSGWGDIDPALAEWMKSEATAYAKHLLDPLSARPGERLFRFGLAPEEA